MDTNNFIEVKSFNQAQYLLLKGYALYAKLDDAEMLARLDRDKVEIRIQPKIGRTCKTYGTMEMFHKTYDETFLKITYYASDSIDIRSRKNNVFDKIADRIREIHNES